MENSLKETFESVRAAASNTLPFLKDAEINKILNVVADEVLAQSEYILAENKKDLARMDKSNPKYDRLMLTAERISGIVADMRNVAKSPSPLGKVLEHTVRPNGLDISRTSVPIGVVGVIYEARPNVCLDVFSLCLKAGNACLLKGGKDAAYSDRAILNTIHAALERNGTDPHILGLLPATHEAADELLHARGYVDVVIPRGGRRLIDFVRDNAVIPVIETGAGVCHTFFHKDGDIAKGAAIIENAKTRRVSVCNALDCFIIDSNRIDDLPALCGSLQKEDVTLYADEACFRTLEKSYPGSLLKHADEGNYGREYLDYKMTVIAVPTIEAAVRHIAKYGSGHSECIVTDNKEAANYFTKTVDAACVYVNAPTSFTDGAQFGLGAEIGISTQKLHARGPMGLEALTTYKWIINGEGQIRK